MVLYDMADRARIANQAATPFTDNVQGARIPMLAPGEQLAAVLPVESDMLCLPRFDGRVQLPARFDYRDQMQVDGHDDSL